MYLDCFSPEDCCSIYGFTSTHLHVRLERERRWEIDLADVTSKTSLRRRILALPAGGRHRLTFARRQVGQVGQRLEDGRAAAKSDLRLMPLPLQMHVQHRPGVADGDARVTSVIAVDDFHHHGVGCSGRGRRSHRNLHCLTKFFFFRYLVTNLCPLHSLSQGKGNN